MGKLITTVGQDLRGNVAYSAADAARYFGVAPKTIYAWVRAGKLRAHYRASDHRMCFKASSLYRYSEDLI